MCGHALESPTGGLFVGSSGQSPFDRARLQQLAASGTSSMHRQAFHAKNEGESPIYGWPSAG